MRGDDIVMAQAGDTMEIRDDCTASEEISSKVGGSMSPYSDSMGMVRGVRVWRLDLTRLYVKI